MRSRHCLYALFALLLWIPQLGAQQITGTVRDQRNGQPMAAVQVFIQGSGIGALTQSTGRGIRHIQTGRVQNYALGIAAGLLVIAATYLFVIAK